MDQQKPTITDIRIRNTSDAHILFEAVSLGLLPMIKRRLDPEERTQVKPGNCYIWEERSADEEAVGMGMERWTDGLQWGPSRTRDDFLFYIQKSVEDGDNSKRLKLGKRRRSQPVPGRSKEQGILSDGTSPLPSSSTSSSTTSPTAMIAAPPPAGEHPPAAEDHKLVKQTYSVYTKMATDSESRPQRKWHLTAYYTPWSVSSGLLKDLGQIPELSSIQVPEHKFRAARVGKRHNPPGGVGPPPAEAVSPQAQSHPPPLAPAIYSPTLEPGRYPPHAHPAGSTSSGGSGGSSPVIINAQGGRLGGHQPNRSWPSPSGDPYAPYPTPLSVSRHPHASGTGRPPYQRADSSPTWPGVYTYGPPPPASASSNYPAMYPPTVASSSPTGPLRVRHLSDVPYPPRPHSRTVEYPHSPSGSDDGDRDVEMRPASTGGPGAGLTTLVENRALPPLDFSNAVGFPARTAEDERTLWALTRGFNR